jgi:hypothetical protein
MPNFKENTSPAMKRTPYKMKGSPMQRNFGISPMNKVKNEKTTTIVPKNPKTGASITGDDYDQIVSSKKDMKSYVTGYNKMTKEEKIKHKKPVDGTYLINKQGNIKKI